MRESVGFTVVEYNQASGWPEVMPYVGLSDRAGAREMAEHLREVKPVARRERYAVAEVFVVEEPE